LSFNIFFFFITTWSVLSPRRTVSRSTYECVIIIIIIIIGTHTRIVGHNISVSVIAIIWTSLSCYPFPRWFTDSYLIIYDVVVCCMYTYIQVYQIPIGNMEWVLKLFAKEGIKRNILLWNSHETIKRILSIKSVRIVEKRARPMDFAKIIWLGIIHNNIYIRRYGLLWKNRLYSRSRDIYT